MNPTALNPRLPGRRGPVAVWCNWCASSTPMDGRMITKFPARFRQTKDTGCTLLDCDVCVIRF